jgi:hypothetical protein
MKNKTITLLSWIGFITWLALSGCTSVNTFPAIARPGSTVSLMAGGSENARKNTIGVILVDAAGQRWDLKSLGLVKSVFNLRPDGVSNGLQYSPYLDTYVSWANGHEPLQTVVVADIPSGVALGNATINVSLNVSDNSSGVADPAKITLEIIAGTGNSDSFLRKDVLTGSNIPVDFGGLEPAPHAKIIFGNGTDTSATPIGAATLVVSFDSSVVNPNDLNVYVPESTVRGSIASTGAFGSTQRMVYWHQDGLKLYINIIAPQGISPAYLQTYIIHPRGLTGSPNFNILSAQVYGTDGNVIANTPTLTYSP